MLFSDRTLRLGSLELKRSECSVPISVTAWPFSSRLKVPQEPLSNGLSSKRFRVAWGLTVPRQKGAGGGVAEEREAVRTSLNYQIRSVLLRLL